MAIYAYRCRTCGNEKDSTTRGDTLGPCPGRVLYQDDERVERQQCDGELRRQFIIRTEAVMQEHWNKTLNRPIGSNKQFDEALRRESDIASLRTGMAHKFERCDPDKKALGVTEEGMDSTNKVRAAKGLPPVK